MTRPPLLALLCASALSACATAHASRIDDASLGWMMPYLVPGSTRREDLRQRFGPPTGTFEDGRILSWRLALRGFEFFPVRPGVIDDGGGLLSWGAARHSLVAVFDEQGVVRRFSCVAVR